MSDNDSAARRSEARERRRAAARPDENGGDGNRGGLESAARAAAAAAAVGAALGAVKALAGHDNDEPEHERTPTATEEQPDEHDEHDEDEENDENDDDEQAENAQQRGSAPEASDDEQPERQQEQQPRERQRDASPSRPREGASAGTVRSIAAQAREQLRELQGRDVESITALERIDDGWRVTCEVVEVERIPNSTDVLATYVIELDGDGELITFERVRRYYRAQADLGGER
jgi:outer membrane biosynthesis protein TonB